MSSFRGSTVSALVSAMRTTQVYTILAQVQRYTCTIVPNVKKGLFVRREVDVNQVLCPVEMTVRVSLRRLHGVIVKTFGCEQCDILHPGNGMNWSMSMT